MRKYIYLASSLIICVLTFGVVNSVQSYKKDLVTEFKRETSKVQETSHENCKNDNITEQTWLSLKASLCQTAENAKSNILETSHLHKQNFEKLKHLRSRARLLREKCKFKSKRLDEQRHEIQYKQAIAEYLEKYIQYEHDSQRVEKQDVFYRLKEILNQSSRLLVTQYDIDLRLYNRNSLSLEYAENSYLAAFEVKSRKKTLQSEHDVLDLITKGTNQLLSSIETFEEHLEELEKCIDHESHMYEQEEQLLLIHQEIGYSRLVSQMFLDTLSFSQNQSAIDLSHIELLSKIIKLMPSLQNEIVRNEINSIAELEHRITQDLEEKNKKGTLMLIQAISGRLTYFQLLISSSIKAIETEEQSSLARSAFSEYLRLQISVQTEKLNQKAEVLGKNSQVAKLQQDRRIELQQKGAATSQEKGFYENFATHFNQASARSWADQATLTRLTKSLKLYEIGEVKNRDLLIKKKELFSMWAENIAHIMASDSEQELIHSMLHKDHSDEMSYEPYLAIDKVICWLLAIESKNELIFRPFEDRPLAILNDPSPIQAKGPDDILQKAFVPKDSDMVETRNTLFRIWKQLRDRQ